jgi:hypothetical protein
MFINNNTDHTTEIRGCKNMIGRLVNIV